MPIFNFPAKNREICCGPIRISPDQPKCVIHSAFLDRTAGLTPVPRTGPDRTGPNVLDVCTQRQKDSEKICRHIGGIETVYFKPLTSIKRPTFCSLTKYAKKISAVLLPVSLALFGIFAKHGKRIPAQLQKTQFYGLFPTFLTENAPLIRLTFIWPPYVTLGVVPTQHPPSM